MRAFYTTGFNADLFFSAIFRPLVVSGMVSYFAYRGSLGSVLAVSFTFNMASYILPFLPSVSSLVYSLIVCGLAFLSAYVYSFVNNETRRMQRKRDKRLARYEKKPKSMYFITTGALGLLIAFALGAFPVYPTVVLTGSMSPAFERGSVVFIERVTPEEVVDMVGEGEILHFTSPHGVDFIHRVVDFRWDAEGQRTFITRGDAAELVDPHPVAQEDVLGIVRAFVPFFGYPIIFMQNLFGR
jgi:signal peptidase